jgi:hypothetical protein
LAQRKGREGPTVDLDQFLGRAKTRRMFPYEDVSVSPKEVTTQYCTCVVTKVVVVQR